MRSLRFRRTDCNLLTCGLKSKQKWRYKEISMKSHYETSKFFLNFSFAIKIATSEDICLHLQPMCSCSSFSSFLLVFGYYVNIFSSSFFGKTYNQKCEDGHTTNLFCVHWWYRGLIIWRIAEIDFLKKFSDSTVQLKATKLSSKAKNNS